MNAVRISNRNFRYQVENMPKNVHVRHSYTRLKRKKRFLSVSCVLKQKFNNKFINLSKVLFNFQVITVTKQSNANSSMCVSKSFAFSGFFNSGIS